MHTICKSIDAETVSAITLLYVQCTYVKCLSTRTNLNLPILNLHGVERKYAKTTDR